MIARAWLGLQSRLSRASSKRDPDPFQTLIRRYAPGRSFADIGCMWGIDGANAFLAEEVGATRVTAFDAMEPTEAFEAERTRRESQVRFLLGDINDPATPEAVGKHDVVWCTGVLYHAPSPMLTLERLGAMCSEYLIVGTKAIPEIPGFPQAGVFFPGLSRRQRSQYSRWVNWGVEGPYDTDPVRSYANWWWGLTPSAFRALMSGYDIVETVRGPLGLQIDNYFVVGRAR